MTFCPRLATNSVEHGVLPATEVGEPSPPCDMSGREPTVFRLDSCRCACPERGPGQSKARAVAGGVRATAHWASQGVIHRQQKRNVRANTLLSTHHQACHGVLWEFNTHPNIVHPGMTV